MERLPTQSYISCKSLFERNLFLDKVHPFADALAPARFVVFMPVPAFSAAASVAALGFAFVGIVRFECAYASRADASILLEEQIYVDEPLQRDGFAVNHL